VREGVAHQDQYLWQPYQTAFGPYLFNPSAIKHPNVLLQGSSWPDWH